MECLCRKCCHDNNLTSQRLEVRQQGMFSKGAEMSIFRFPAKHKAEDTITHVGSSLIHQQGSVRLVVPTWDALELAAEGSRRFLHLSQRPKEVLISKLVALLQREQCVHTDHLHTVNASHHTQVLTTTNTEVSSPAHKPV